MSTTTQNLGLVKPDPINDAYDVNVTNGNMDKIDAAIAGKLDKNAKALDTEKWKGWTIYNSLNEIGLTGEPTVVQIANEMSDRSVFDTELFANPNMPYRCTRLIVNKFFKNLISIEAYNSDIGNGTLLQKSIGFINLGYSTPFTGFKEVFHSGNYGAVVIKSTSATLTLADSNTVVAMIGSSAKTITVPDFTNVPFPPGTQITFLMVEAGSVTFAPAGGVIIVSKDAKRTIDGQFASATLVKVFADSWVLIGSLKA